MRTLFEQVSSIRFHIPWCWLFGHKWEKIVRPYISADKKICTRCGEIRYNGMTLIQ